jgi:probable rRNA maturation factor
MQESRPRTMILIDPELELSRVADALNPDSAKPSAGPAAKPGRKLPAKPLRLPSTRTLGQFMTRAQAAVRLRGQVTVLLTGDATMRDLNRRFRGKNKATDVLSFPASNLVQNQGKNQEKSQEKGDVAISVQTAHRQSAEQGHTLGTEIKVLMLHGLLHLAGYDHETDAGEMQRSERSLRERLGLPLGLIERASSPTLSQKTRKDGARRGREGASSPTLSQKARKDGARRGREGASSPTLSQKARKDGARRGREGTASPTLSQKARRDGARGRKATTGPSTSAAKMASAQDDKAERASRPKKKSRVLARGPSTAWVPRSRPDTERRRKP